MKHTLVFPFPIFTFALLMTVTYSVAIIYYKFSAYCQIIVCEDILEFIFLNSWNHHKKCPGLLVGKKKKRSHCLEDVALQLEVQLNSYSGPSSSKMKSEDQGVAGRVDYNDIVQRSWLSDAQGKAFSGPSTLRCMFKPIVVINTEFHLNCCLSQTCFVF